MLATQVMRDRVLCTDAFDRERSVGLWAAPIPGKVVLVAPPAEAALLTPTQARDLRDRLDLLANAVEAEQQRLADRQTLYGATPV